VSLILFTLLEKVYFTPQNFRIDELLEKYTKTGINGHDLAQQLKTDAVFTSQEFLVRTVGRCLLNNCVE
jgi:hypothetical protein